MADNKKVLSIQSHVVHGHVGNTAATFPLQLLGYQVDVINSVQLSNHTGYTHYKGQVLEAVQLQELIAGLRSNKLLKYSHILTGYIGSSSFLNEVYQLVLELKSLNPHISYVCDPVLGDNGQLYVPEELTQIYREKFIQIADIITPNSFEAQLLTGVDIKSETDAKLAMKVLLDKGVKTVIITSVELEQDELLLLAANRDSGETVRLQYPKIPGSFTGSGDVFTAVLMGWLGNGHTLKIACEKAVSTLQAVLNRTLQHALELSNGGTPSAEQIELQLIQCKREIEEPPEFITSNSH